MPRIVTCSHCERSLRVPDNLLGKKVRCPNCRVQFVAGADDADDDDIVEDFSEEEPEKTPARRRSAERDERSSGRPHSGSRRRDEDDDDDFEDEDSPRGPSPREEKAAWKKTALGIHLEMLGIWIWLGSLGIALLLVVLSFLVSFAKVFKLVMIMGWLISATGVLGGLALGGLTLAGYGLCLFAPPKRGSALRPLSIVAFALLALSVLVALVNLVIGLVGSFFSPMFILLTMMGGLGALPSFIVHLFFLRSVCRNARARNLEGTPISVLIAFIIYGVVATVIYAILLLLIRVMGQASIYIIPSVMVAIGVTGLAMMWWYSTVLRDIRDAVDSYRRRKQL